MGVGVQGRLWQAGRMHGCERGLGGRWEWEKEKEKQKDDMTGYVGRKDQSVDPGREWLIMHMQRMATPQKKKKDTSIIICPHTRSGEQVCLRSVSKHTHKQRIKYSQESQRNLHLFPPSKPNINVALLRDTWYFSAVQYFPCAAVGAAMSLKWSALTCALVRAGSRRGGWIVLPWMAVAVPGQTCQLGWHQRSDSWFGTRSGRQHCKCESECVFFVCGAF